MKKKKKEKQPQYMIDRIKHVTLLGERGYNSCLLAHTLDSIIKQWYEKERNNEKT